MTKLLEETGKLLNLQNCTHNLQQLTHRSQFDDSFYSVSSSLRYSSNRKVLQCLFYANSVETSYKTLKFSYILLQLVYNVTKEDQWCSTISQIFLFLRQCICEFLQCSVESSKVYCKWPEIFSNTKPIFTSLSKLRNSWTLP